jgi:glucans biosynthesis protein
MINRRSLLTASGAAWALASLGSPADAFAATGLRLGPPRPFSFDRLAALAKTLSTQPHVASDPLPAEILQRIDYDAHGQIKFDPDNALFRDGPGQFPVTFFHLGRYFQVPVRMHVLENAGGDDFAREIVYDAAYFSMPPDSPARELPEGAGFAGFRVQESRFGDPRKLPWQRNDWAAFLGASYFRSIGELFQYGLSARGVALDTAMPDRAEEFPAFTRFYFAPPAGEASNAMTIYALLESPGITGAYQFVLQRNKAVLMDIDAHLFPRRDVGRFGLAPLTSMFWYSETVKPAAIDWRPEVHDSDGLAIWNGAGERIWRPLNNPPQTRTSAFADKDPRGFGLMQRDRAFDHYLDGVHYDRRPSLWVEPLGPWGEGAVQLIEIPTDDEINDNILACWVPSTPAKAGSAFRLQYRLHWSAEEPFASPFASPFATPLARCVATRIGRGGQPGTPRPPGVRKFVVEFLGKPLESLPFGVTPELALTASSGKLSSLFAEAVPNGIPGHWRAQFDFMAEGTEPVEMRLSMKNGGQTLTETWLYQFQPF